MLHLRQEMGYSTYFLALEVNQDQRNEGTNILNALVIFLSG